jgi:GTPase SAR1 family protein
MLQTITEIVGINLNNMNNKIAEYIDKIGVLIQDSEIGEFIINISLLDIFPCLSDDKQKKNFLKTVQDEVTRKLNPYDYHGKLIILKKENIGNDLVNHPDVSDVRKEPITDPDSNIFDIFNYKDGAYRQLLIVGKPGSGKTTTLYELTQKLIAEAEAEADEDKRKPIPVVVNLFDWKKDQISMREWLVGKLRHKYKLKKRLFRKWFAEGKILPLLDGLDEVKSEYQHDCVLAINQLMEEENAPEYLVVCCRIDEYKSLIINNDYSNLKFFQAIELPKLTVDQIENYLKEIKPDFTAVLAVMRYALISHKYLIHKYLIFYLLADSTNRCIWKIIRDRGHLLELLDTPLMLHIAIEVYREIFPDELNLPDSSEKLQPYLFNQYIASNLPRKDIPVTEIARNINTTRLLIWLAHNLKKRNQKELLIEEIQPNWLPKYQIIYHISVGLILSLFLLIISIFLAQIVKLTFFHYLGALIIILSISQDPSIKIVEGFTRSNWSLKQVKWAWIISLFAALCWGVVTWRDKGIVAGGKVFLITAIAATLVSVSTGFTGVAKSRKTYANQGIIKSCQNAIIFGLFIGGICTSIGILIDLIIDGTIDFFKVDALFGIIIGLMGGLFMGGITCIQHSILRLILCCNGLPRNFALFLDYATQKGFLQQIGGSYQFRHDLLRDHFATQLPRYQNNR